MRWFKCTRCSYEELVHPKDFIKDCCQCKSVMVVKEVDDRLVEEYEMQKLNEVKTRNSNTSTLVEVVVRKKGKNLVERIDHQESGQYEEVEPEGTGSQDPSTQPA